jgi:predicted amidohydrolase
VIVPFLVLAAVAALHAATPIAVPSSGWQTWSPRAEIAPRTWVDQFHKRTPAGALAISGNSNPAAYGGWHHRVENIEAGKWYRLRAHYRTEGVPNEMIQVQARLDWLDAAGKRAGQPEFAWQTTPDGEWTRIEAQAPAPAKASAVVLQLYLANAPSGTVWWDEIALEQIDAPAPRPVTVATINLQPSRTKDPQVSVKQFIEAVDQKVTKADIVVLPEGITIVGTGKSYADVSEPIPGPTTTALGELAMRKNTYIVAGIYEREGSAVYNTAVLLDRKGNVAGKYRKVYIPREEYEGGISPGFDYPVFRTDFGTVGMMICWDVQYADPARALALRGAEIVLMPIWGGNDVLARARAIENQIFLVSSGYNHPSRIIDPDGEVVANAPERGTFAVATLDLNKRYADRWLGEMKDRFRKELRLDVPVLSRSVQ